MADQRDRKPRRIKTPAYKSHPRALNVSIYDLQGDPVSPEIKRLFEQFAENLVKESGISSLALSVTEG